MKKTTNKPATKKAPAKKQLAKKSPPAKPKRKAEGGSEIVAMLTSLVDSQGKVIDRLAKLAAITQELVQTVGQLGEGVEVLLQAPERIPPAEGGERGNESRAEVPGNVVGMVVVDETDDGDGEGEDGEGEEE
jgi:hypothetical protein